MNFEQQFKEIVTEVVDEKISNLELEIKSPFILLSDVSNHTQKEARWIRENWCTTKLEKLDLVKKIGGLWHFKHPEFLNYIHDVWWEEQ